jgi:hypothetical protein
MTQFIFTLTKWDFSGNILLIRKTLKITRKSKVVAQNYLYKKYNNLGNILIELDTIN